jgi:hypothetical protein
MKNPNPELGHPEQTDADKRTRIGLTYLEVKAMVDEFYEEINSRPEGTSSEVEQSLIIELLSKLIREKEKFRHVFRTKNGSTYFVLDSGESLRIKRQQADEQHTEYVIQPFIKHIFFISPEDWNRLADIISNARKYVYDLVSPEEQSAFERRKKIYEELVGREISPYEFSDLDIQRRKADKLIGEIIPFTELKNGVIPFELDIVEGDYTTIYKIEGNNLILMGRKFVSGESDIVVPEGVGNTHYGSPVSEIIQN